MYKVAKSETETLYTAALHELVHTISYIIVIFRQCDGLADDDVRATDPHPWGYDPIVVQLVIESIAHTCIDYVIITSSQQRVACTSTIHVYTLQHLHYINQWHFWPFHYALLL